MSLTDVLLINPPCSEEVPAVPHEVGEPIGLCYLAQALRRKGFSVAIVDGFTLGLGVDQIVEIAGIYDPKYCIGVSVLETAALASGALVSKLRAAGLKGHVTAGNYYATLNPERTFEICKGLTSIVRGEGEEAFTLLVESIARGDSSWTRLPGICHMEDGSFVNNGIAAQPPIDSILEPTRECLSQTLDAGGTANLVTGRGCYANCSFCSIVTFTAAGGQKFRARDEGAVVEEIRSVSDEFQIHRYLIPDDNFMPPGKYRWPRVKSFCDAIGEEDLKIEYTITCRVNDLNEEVVTELKKSGLVGVYLGIESFLPRRLKFFNKGVKPEANFRAFDLLDAHGVFAKIGFIMYDPHSTVDEVIEEVSILYERSRNPAVIHTAIDNLIRHSTYPLELQAGTPVQLRMSSEGRAFEAGAGYDYYFDDPSVYALSRFAATLLRFEGAAFAPLRALSYRLSFGSPLTTANQNDVEERCTHLWRRLAQLHFETYLQAARALQAGAGDPTETLHALLTSIHRQLDEVREETLEEIKAAGLTDLERPWVRFHEFPGETPEGDRLIYDPATSRCRTLTAAQRDALVLWSRSSRGEILRDLEQSYGASVAEDAIDKVATMTQKGGFAGFRELEQHYSLEDALAETSGILSDFAKGKVGPRSCDYSPNIEEHALRKNLA
ncbi:MAG: radical SAM protein [Erythrobacter sp.]|nr:radical SAM protein [Erythrobacter sp.]